MCGWMNEYVYLWLILAHGSKSNSHASLFCTPPHFFLWRQIINYFPNQLLNAGMELLLHWFLRIRASHQGFCYCFCWPVSNTVFHYDKCYMARVYHFKSMESISHLHPPFHFKPTPSTQSAFYVSITISSYTKKLILNVQNNIIYVTYTSHIYFFFIIWYILRDVCRYSILSSQYRTIH